MNRTFLLLTALLCLPLTACGSQNREQAAANTASMKAGMMGQPVYIQIFKEEGILELYVQKSSKFVLLDKFSICKFSGGLGPKQRTGDLKSPEGFYQATARGLNPNSRFHKAINVGYPNSYDLAQGYTGDHLLIHGKCSSIGCYAMTNEYIDQIYAFVNAALKNGQPTVSISIYPFRMTDKNLQRHRNSSHIAFWRQLKPGYDFFVKHEIPPAVDVLNGKYVVIPVYGNSTLPSKYAMTTTK